MTAPISNQKSTNVRARMRRRWTGPRTAAVLLRTAERRAPGLGARLAVRLWLTIPPRGTATTTSATTTTTGTRTTLDGGIVVETWGAGPPVYLLHGWAGHRGQFAEFTEPLAQAGYRVIAIDAPGHGDSGPGRHGPRRADMLDFIGALRSATVRYGRPHAVIGHSFGASAAAVATLDGLPARRLVLIAPVATISSGLDYFARIISIGPRIRARMTPRIERIAGRPAADFDIAARAAELDELPPALVIHDTSDKEVPFGDGALVAGAWPGGRLLASDGLGHKRILRDAGLVETVTAFLAHEQNAVMT